MSTKKLTSKEIMERLKNDSDMLEKFGVKKIGLFGSFVRGEQKKKSDIDFLVEFKIATFDNYMGLHSDLAKKFRQKVDLVSIKALKKRIKPYILKEVIWL